MSDLRIARRKAWARSLIHAAGDTIPRYGSDAWARLPDTDPAKVAAA